MMTGSSISQLLKNNMLIFYSLRCVQLICGVLGRAGEKGRKERLEAARNGEVAFNVNHSLKMPQEYYEALAKDDSDRQVIDLRDEGTIGKVRFAPDQKI